MILIYYKTFEQIATKIFISRSKKYENKPQKERKKQKNGAVEKTRTSTDLSTATSTLRVYQFRHDRTTTGKTPRHKSYTDNFALTCSTIFLNTSGLSTANFARTFLSIEIPAFVKPLINVEYFNPNSLTAALIR